MNAITMNKGQKISEIEAVIKRIENKLDLDTKSKTYLEEFNILLDYRDHLKSLYQERMVARLELLDLGTINSLLSLISEDCGEYSKKYLVYYMLGGWVAELSDKEFSEQCTDANNHFRGQLTWYDNIEILNGRISHVIGSPDSY
jgi:hypothetical protein